MLAPLPTVAGVGMLPAVVAPERARMVVLTTPVNSDGAVAELVGEQVTGNRVLVIGDSIMASTATRYTGYMCDELVPLGWSVEVEAEPSRSVDFGNLVLDRRLDPDRGEDYDWDAAVVHLGSNYGSDQERFEEELRTILYRLAPRPTLLFTVTEYKPSYAEANESIRKLAGEFENVTLLDWEQVSKYPGVLTGDRLHPTDEGRHVLVDMVAQTLGPATLGEGECLKSQLTDDSAAGRGGVNGPASNPTGAGSGGGTTASTVRPTTTTPPGGGGRHTLRRWRWRCVGPPARRRHPRRSPRAARVTTSPPIVTSPPVTPAPTPTPPTGTAGPIRENDGPRTGALAFSVGLGPLSEPYPTEIAECEVLGRIWIGSAVRDRRPGSRFS